LRRDFAEIWWPWWPWWPWWLALNLGWRMWIWKVFDVLWILVPRWWRWWAGTVQHTQNNLLELASSESWFYYLLFERYFKEIFRTPHDTLISCFQRTMRIGWNCFSPSATFWQQKLHWKQVSMAVVRPSHKTHAIHWQYYNS
jgi:hypothetical protein